MSQIETSDGDKCSSEEMTTDEDQVSYFLRYMMAPTAPFLIAFAFAAATGSVAHPGAASPETAARSRYHHVQSDPERE